MGSGVLPLAMATRLSRKHNSEIRYQNAAVLSELWSCRCPEEASCVRVFERSLPPWFPISDFCHLISASSLPLGAGAPAHRAISTGQLRRLPCFHLRPIDVVVY